MTCLAALGASLVFALPAGAQTPAATDQGALAWGPFPPVARALEVRAREGKLPTLRDLLTQLGAASGVAFSTDDVSECRLNEMVLHITSDVTVAAERVYPFVESLLSQHDFFLTVMSTGTPLLIGVHATGSGAEQPAVFDVPPGQLGFLRMHPALLVQTSLSLPSVDVRTLGNSLRTLQSSQHSGVIPIANSNTVALKGIGQSVANLIALLQRVETDCAADIAQSTDRRDGESNRAQASPSSAPFSRAPAVWEAFPPLKHALEFRRTDGRQPRLDELLTQLSQASGVVFSMDPHVDMLTAQTLINLSVDASIPADGAWAFAEALLLQNGLVLSVMNAAKPPLIGVHSTGMTAMRAGSQDRGEPVDVPIEHLDFLRAHPALLVQTSLSLPALDVRTLGNGLRVLCDDSSVGVIPVANSHDIVLVGTARFVVDTVDLLLRVQANCVAGEEQAAAVKRELDGLPPKK